MGRAIARQFGQSAGSRVPGSHPSTPVQSNNTRICSCPACRSERAVSKTVKSDTDNLPRNRTVTKDFSFREAISITHQFGSEISPKRYSQTARIAHFLPTLRRQRQNPPWRAKSALMGQILQSMTSDGLANTLIIRQRGDGEPRAR